MNPEASTGSFAPPTGNVVERLRYRADHHGHDRAFTYLVDGENEQQHLTYLALDAKARSIATELTRRRLRGERALLLYPPGLDFISAFFGCLYAGVVAVPAYPPRRNRHMGRIESISDNAQAKVALTVHSEMTRVKGMLDDGPHLKSLEWLATDRLAESLADQWKMPDITGDTLAFLQYTSGSTGTPKGVILTHANLMHNSALISYAFEMTRSVVGAFWLPMYHDMGLIGGILQPMYSGCPNVFMSPMAFLQKPYRWLRLITRHRATISGGPNFAYDLAARKITPEQRAKLDLSSWELAFNGAEPIRADTLRFFYETFKDCGLRPETFFPCYGMAEATLIISGGLRREPPTIRSVDGEALDNGQVVDSAPDEHGARELVGCGSKLPDQRTHIVDPDTRELLSPGRVGEIWVSGPSVALGYWNDPDATSDIFHASPVGSDEGPFLRTGDLGFIQDNELFVTGRRKDLIIIRGVNRYPQDIEQTVETVHRLLRRSAGAAVTVNIGGQQRLVIVNEVEKRSDFHNWQEITGIICREVVAEHEVPVDAVTLIRAGTIPKTSSGKIQRHACAKGFLDRSLAIVAEWVRFDLWHGKEDQVEETSPVVVPTAPLQTKKVVAASIPLGNGQNGAKLDVVSEKVAKIVMDQVKSFAGERASEITLDTNIVELGLDSLERTEIVVALEDQFGGTFPREVLDQLTTCRDVSEAVEKFIGTEPQDRIQPAAVSSIPQEHFSISKFPEFQRYQEQISKLSNGEVLRGQLHEFEGTVRGVVTAGSQQWIHLAGFNYLGLADNPLITSAAKQALDTFGTSTAASRLSSGERLVHRELERALANWIGVDDTVTTQSGFLAISATIGHLFGTGDIILYDSLAPGGIVQGSILSGARRRPFPHNDFTALEQILREVRHDYRRVLIALEGLSGLGGDMPDLARFTELRRQFQTFLLVDLTHALGTVGADGRGVADDHSIGPDEVDLWSGSLDTALASSGGFVAGQRSLIDYLRHTAPPLVESVALSPASAAAALAAVELIHEHSNLILDCQANAVHFRKRAADLGVTVLGDENSPLLPIVVGDSELTWQTAQHLLDRGVVVEPVVAPAVAPFAVRLRAAVSATHTQKQIEQAVSAIAAECCDPTCSTHSAGKTV